MRFLKSLISKISLRSRSKSEFDPVRDFTQPGRLSPEQIQADAIVNQLLQETRIQNRLNDRVNGKMEQD